MDLNRNKSGESPVSFPWYQNVLDVSHAFQKTALVADMCFNIHVITAKTTSTHDEYYFSYILILFALKLRRLHAKLIFPPSFQTWKKYVFLRYLLNYAYDFD